MGNPTTCCAVGGTYCARIDAVFNLPGVHVVDVGWDGDRPTLTIETDPVPVGCPSCGMVAVGHGRRVRVLHDIPAFGSPVRLTWRKRTYRCAESACSVGVFSEVHELARPRAKLTERAAWWSAGSRWPGARSGRRSSRS